MRGLGSFLVMGLFEKLHVRLLETSAECSVRQVKLGCWGETCQHIAVAFTVRGVKVNNENANATSRNTQDTNFVPPSLRGSYRACSRDAVSADERAELP